MKKITRKPTAPTVPAPCMEIPADANLWQWAVQAPPGMVGWEWCAEQARECRRRAAQAMAPHLLTLRSCWEGRADGLERVASLLRRQGVRVQASAPGQYGANDNPRVSVWLRRHGSDALAQVVGRALGAMGIQRAMKQWPASRVRRELPGATDEIALEWEQLLARWKRGRDWQRAERRARREREQMAARLQRLANELGQCALALRPEAEGTE